MLPCCASQYGDEAEMGADSNTLDALEFTKERLCHQWYAPSEQDSVFWAMEEMNLTDDGLPKVGTVLLANPDVFLRNGLRQNGVDFQEDTLMAAVHRTGWRRQGDEALPRRDRARLPVVLIRHQDDAGIEGLHLDVWCGQLLGDLGFRAFQSRPLYLGCKPQDGSRSEKPMLSMLHGYPEMPGAACIGESLGLSDFSDFHQACDWVGPEGPGSALRFKFFLGFLKWSPSEAKRELSAQAGIWIPVRASTDLLLREPDSSFEEPLWVQLALQVGGNIAELARKHNLLAE